MSYVSRPPRLPIPGDPDLDLIYSGSKSPPAYMGNTFAMYCHLLPISEGICSASIQSTDTSAATLPIAFAEESFCKLLGLSDRLPRTLVQSAEMTHHAAVFQASFHSTIMELFRPYLSRNIRLRNPIPDALPEEVFIASATRMVEITRLYCYKYRDTPASCSIAWFIAPVYTTNLSLKGIPPSDSSELHRQNFEMCVRAFMGLGFTYAIREQILKGCMAMAVSNGLFTRRESKKMLDDVLYSGGQRPTEDDLTAKLMTDGERVAEISHLSQVDDLTREYNDFVVTDSFRLID